MSNPSADWRSERIRQEARDLCPACENALWLSFYFDGFGYSDQAGPRSNIAKLFSANRDDPIKGFRRLYYPGLGAAFDPEARALAAAVSGKLGSKVAEMATDTAKDGAVGHVRDTIKDAWQRSRGIRDRDSFWSRASWTARKTWSELADDVRRLRHPKRAVRRATRYLVREWMDFMADVASHPWRAAKEVGKQAVSMTAGAVAEGIGPVRDSALASALFNTGVDTRLKVATDDFEREVREARRAGRVKFINVAVFGYDMGGGLALAFINRLTNEVCRGGRYEGAEVRYRFMGLFDCVTNRYDDNLLTGYMPLSNAVSSRLQLPGEVEYCVHFAAAHEQRFYKPLTFIGGEMDNPRAEREEMLFPGSQVDVGGGVEDGENGVSSDFSRLPLSMMLHRAWGRGVPLQTIDDMASSQADLAIEFMPSDEITAQWHRYRKAARRLATEARKVIKINPAPILLPGQPGYGQGRAGQAASCSYETVATVPTNIEEELKGHVTILIAWLRQWYDENRGAMEEQSATWFGAATGDSHQLGRYAKLADEIETMERAVAQIDMFGNKLYPQDIALFDMWNWNDVDPEVTSLYPFFMAHLHDSMAECNIESAFGDFIYARHYLNSRPMNRLATAPDSSFLEGLVAKYNSMRDGAGDFAREVVEDWSGR